MHGSTPVPPDPESERRGHELRDVAIKPIMIFLVVLFVAGGLIQGAMSLLMDGVIIPDAQVGVPSYSDLDKNREHQKEILDSKFRDIGNPRADYLQRDTTKDMQRMYEEDEAALHLSWIDKTGKVHIPIERAMKKVIEKGLLKSREVAPTTPIDPEYPYPAHSEPYKSTP